MKAMDGKQIFGRLYAKAMLSSDFLYNGKMTESQVETEERICMFRDQHRTWTLVLNQTEAGLSGSCSEVARVWSTQTPLTENGLSQGT